MSALPICERLREDACQRDGWPDELEFEAADTIEALYEALECIQHDIRSGEMHERACREAHADAIDTLLRPVRGEQ